MQATKTFADNLRTTMDVRGISQRGLANLTGVTFSYINRILLGKQTPSLEICDKIADALDVELAVLLKKNSKKQKSA